MFDKSEESAHLSAKCIRSLLAAFCLSVLPFAASAAEHRGPHGIVMVDIPAGNFTMGACLPHSEVEIFIDNTPSCGTPDSDAGPSEGPPRRVQVAAFQLGKTEVTLGQFKAFIRAKGRNDLLTSDFIKENNQGDNAPVVMVSWNDARAFIAWLNETTSGGWRLPSEAEWEYACRAGGRHKYCGSNDVNAVAWHWDNSGKRQRPVGTKAANAWGLHDMSGNVWEWVQDCWHSNYHGAPGTAEAWTTGCSRESRDLRGGSWSSNPRNTRASNRFNFSPGFSNNNSGFRLARTR